MLGLPFRIVSTIAIALFFSSKWLRRAVAGVVISALLVGYQHQAALQALAGPQASHAPLLKALAALAGG